MRLRITICATKKQKKERGNMKNISKFILLSSIVAGLCIGDAIARSRHRDGDEATTSSDECKKHKHQKHKHKKTKSDKSKSKSDSSHSSKPKRKSRKKRTETENVAEVVAVTTPVPVAATPEVVSEDELLIIQPIDQGSMNEPMDQGMPADMQ